LGYGPACRGCGRSPLTRVFGLPALLGHTGLVVTGQLVEPAGAAHDRVILRHNLGARNILRGELVVGVEVAYEGGGIRREGVQQMHRLGILPHGKPDLAFPVKVPDHCLEGLHEAAELLPFTFLWDYAGLGDTFLVGSNRVNPAMQQLRGEVHRSVPVISGNDVAFVVEFFALEQL